MAVYRSLSITIVEFGSLTVLERGCTLVGFSFITMNWQAEDDETLSGKNGQTIIQNVLIHSGTSEHKLLVSPVFKSVPLYRCLFCTSVESLYPTFSDFSSIFPAQSMKGFTALASSGFCNLLLECLR